MNYEIIKGTDRKGFFIRVRSVNKAKHFAVHRTFLKRDKDGQTTTHQITESNCEKIIQSLEKKVLQRFIIVENDIDKIIEPEDITHKLKKKK